MTAQTVSNVTELHRGPKQVLESARAAQQRRCLSVCVTSATDRCRFRLLDAVRTADRLPLEQSRRLLLTVCHGALRRGRLGSARGRCNACATKQTRSLRVRVLVLSWRGIQDTAKGSSGDEYQWQDEWASVHGKYSGGAHKHHTTPARPG